MRLAAIVSVIVFVIACAATPSTPIKTLSGWVSDAACGAEHVGGKNPGCVTKCLKGGAHSGHPEWAPQAMVLVVDDSERILVIDNPESLIGREAKHVIVRAHLEGDRLRVVEVLQ